MLAYSLWYDKYNSGWGITAFKGWIPEKFDVEGLPVGWYEDGRLIPPHCFGSEDDNYEHYAEKFNIADGSWGDVKFEDFVSNTGKYFGEEITTLDPIDFYDSKVTLTPSLSDCFANKVYWSYTEDFEKISLDIKDRFVWEVTENYVGQELHDRYEILLEIPLFLCEKFAPNIQGECKSSYLVKVYQDSGGSKGWMTSVRVYGLFKLAEKESVMVPLKSFKSENIARDFFEDLGLNN